jgi:hypothetical protein
MMAVKQELLEASYNLQFHTDPRFRDAMSVNEMCEFRGVINGLSCDPHAIALLRRAFNRLLWVECSYEKELSEGKQK